MTEPTPEAIISNEPLATDSVPLSEPSAQTAAPLPAALSSNATLSLLGAGAFLLIGLGSLSLWSITEGGSAPTEQAAAVTAAVPTNEFEQLEFEAKSIYVYDLVAEKELFSKNADSQLPLASLTKIALILAVSEVLQPETIVRISREAVFKGEGGGLGTGDTWRVDDLIDFTLVASSNAGAEALAEAANAPFRERYPHYQEDTATVTRMNTLMGELGLAQTYFLNPSGLDMSVTQASSFSTAREVALLAAFASRTASDLFSPTSGLKTITGPQNGAKTYAENTNDALPDIPGLILGKTGFTDLAGGNLVAIFDVGPARPIAAVVMGSSKEGRFEDMKKLVSAVQKTILAE